MLVATLVAVSLAVLVAMACADPGRAARPAPAFDQRLHDELIGMLERDRSGRAGGPDLEGDDERTLALSGIVARSGWPTYAQVGPDGGTAAFTIALHSDYDPPFQARPWICWAPPSRPGRVRRPSWPR